MKQKKRLFCLLLVLCLALPLIVSCKDTSDDESKSDTSNDETEATEALVPHLGERDLGGYTLTFLAPKDRTEDVDVYDECQFYYDETSEEPVYNAFFERNTLIENEYNCNIELITVENSQEVVERIRLASESGIADFQVAAGGVFYLSSLATEGKLYDFNNLPDSNLNLEGDWWDQAAIRDLSIANYLPFITGDIIVTDNEATWAIYFNKTIAEENGLGDLFEIVRNDEWTMDKMGELAKTVTTDNGDGVMTIPSDDVWGNIAQTYDGVAYMWGAEQAMVEKDADDLPVFRLTDQTNVDTWQKVFDLLCNQEYTAMGEYFYPWGDPNYGAAYDNFINGKALFTSKDIAFVNSDAMRNTDVDYGILPMPKRDSEQEEYSSSCTVYWATFLAMPTVLSSDDVEKSTFILEAMGYLGKEMVTYQYYDVTLKGKRSNDPDSPEMLELIFANRTFDLAAVYNWGGDTGALYFYTNLIGQKSDNISSAAESVIEAYTQSMNSTIEYFQALKAQQ